MSESDVKSPREDSPAAPSQEFSAYCESEFERRLNSGEEFDEHLYRKAMALVVEKLSALEGEGQA
jgi:hypothetical protein